MPKTMKDVVAEARDEIEEVDADTARRMLDEGAVIIDVRETDEFERGHIPDAIHIPRGRLEMQIGQRPEMEDHEKPVILYCGSGGRCALAARTLKHMGYTHVMSLCGGLGAWVEAGHAVEVPSGGDDDEE